MKIKTKEVFNIPNILCYIRILLVPVFVITYIRAVTPRDYYLAAAIILFSGFTDLIDGYIARRFNMVSELGKALDPITDKITQGGIIISLLFKVKGMVFLLVLFIIKELFMGISCLILLKRGKKLDGAKIYGKLSTAVFYITMLIIIGMPGLKQVWVTSLMAITAIFFIISFVLYIPVFFKMYKESKAV